MSKDNVRFNPDGFHNMMTTVTKKILATDTSLRAEHGGRPAAEIAPVAQQAFAAIGYPLSDEDALEYAKSVETGEDFNFKIG